MKKGRPAILLEFTAVYLFYLFINLIPWSVALGLGRFFGMLYYKLDKRHAKNTISNLKTAFPEKNENWIMETATNFYKNLGMVFVEIFRLDKFNENNIDKYVEYDFSNIDGIYSKNGILLLTAHFGNWELLAKTFAIKGYPGNVLARPLDNPNVEKILYRLRTASGNRVIYNRENAVKNIMAALAGKQIVGFLPDENASKRIGVFVDFFGKKACTMPGMANIAAKTRAPIIPAFIVRVREKGYLKHRLIIGKPLEVNYTGDRKADTINILNMFSETIENIIKQHPDQWFWIHNRWKTRPEGEK